jgi:two-component system NtrC family sensor kinase
MIAAAYRSGEPPAAGAATLVEADRLAALRRYQILDTPQEPAFDRIVRLAALLLDVPIALISLIDADRQWFKARYGLDAADAPRAVAFCDHAIRGGSVLVIPDAELDPRFCDNPLVTGDMHVRFYAGAPLLTPDGFALGTICVIDRVPRQLNARDAAILTALAEQVLHELEVRSALGELHREVAKGRHTAPTLQGEGGKLEALLNATEAHRREAAAHSHDKLAALGRTAGGVAHELNNLLQPIIGLTQLELDQLPDEGTDEQMESRENLAMILDSGKQAREVVRKVLMFARKAKPAVAPVDFPAALRRSMAFFAALLPTGVDLEQVIDAAAVGVATINEAELDEVMANLAANAAYAMDGNGTLTVRLDRLEMTEAAASLGIAAGSWFRISVADTGLGMDAETKAQIFEPFFTTKPIGQGTGLGLSIAYGVLRDWKGAIAVDSTVGFGSTFALYVPVSRTL